MVLSNIDSDTDDVAIEKNVGQGPPPILRDHPSGPNGDDSNGDPGGSSKPLGNAFLGMLLFIGAEVMFFAGLVGAFIVLRFGASDWPPPGQPRLPVAVTGVNTAILIGSGFMMFRTWRRLKDWNRQSILQGLGTTAALGCVFLLVQGFEWGRLLQFGLTLSSSVYGSIFYTLIGTHAAHVVGAVIWLGIVLLRLKINPIAYDGNNNVGIRLVGLYWYLVVGLWPFLYVMVYLN